MSQPSVLFLLALVPVSAVACSDRGSVPTPGHFTESDFQSLRWLEGEWRGTGGQRPFFEGYESLNDSTIRIHYYADSTRTSERGAGSVYLSGGVIYHEADGGVWVAVQFDSTGIHFVPSEGAENGFRWTQTSPTTWEAVLHFRGGSETRYELSRITN
jgi:hypothetical protein